MCKKPITMNVKMSLVLLFLLCIAVTPFCQLSNGLKAYYSFKGNSADISGNGNDGIIIGSPVLTQDRFGIADCAYAFPGTPNDYISINY